MTELGISRIASEKRNYTDTVVSALLAHASGNLTLSPLGLAVVESAAGMCARALALARVEPDNLRTRALTPSVRASIGRRLVRYGESLHILHVDDTGLRLVDVCGHDVGGQPFGPWTYRVDVAGPDGTATRNVPASSVLHPRLATDAAAPWRGVPPLAWAAASAKLGAAIETRTGQEADGPVGNLITAPRDPGPPADETDEETDPHAGLKRDRVRLFFVDAEQGPLGASGGFWKRHSEEVSDPSKAWWGGGGEEGC